MKLAYEAMDREGQKVADTVQAVSMQEGMEELRRQGLFVTDVREAEDSAVETKGTVSSERLAGTRLPIGQLVLFTRQMAMLLRSGSAVVPALNAIAQQMKLPQFAQMVEVIRDDLEEGITLTDALGRYPHSFDASYCAVVAAGESSAKLPQMFERLAMIIGKRRAMRNKVIGAMIYPLLLTGLSVNILSAMVFFVVPRFAQMFDTLGVELPTSTKVMVGLSVVLKAYWWLWLVLVVGTVTGLLLFLRSDRGKQAVADLQLKIPMVGVLCSRLIQAQIFRILGMLLESRVGLLEAMELARRVTRNSRFRALFEKLDESVSQGDSFSATLEKPQLINPSIVQAIRTGEHSGRLGESITYVADVLDEENGELLNTLTRLVEPLVLIVMGAVVGTIAVSLFMPLFDMTSAI